MMRTLIPLLCVLAIAGCSKKKNEAPVAAQAAAPVRHPAMDDDDDAPKQLDAPEEKFEINEDVVKRYLTYWQRNIEVSHRALKDISHANKEAERKGGMVGVAHALGNGEAIEERAEAQHDALLDLYGFTEYQVRELSQLMRHVAAAKSAAVDGGGMDPSRLSEAREKFGEEAVNAALAHAEEIAALNEQTFGMMK